MIKPAERESLQSVPIPELPVLDFKTIEFYVGNAKQAAYYYNAFFGFDIVAYRGPETGFRETCSYVLRQNTIQFVLTSALVPGHPVEEHISLHGDGVKDIGFTVSEVTEAYQLAIHRGALSVLEPFRVQDEFGWVERATVATYGDTTHTFINREHYTGVFEPGYIEHHLAGKPIGLQRVDHIVGNVEKHRMEDWVHFYENIFGFYVLREYDEKDISTPYSALISKVMANQSGTVKMPLNEPVQGLWKSQIQEFIDFYKSAGVQHIAISTDDIMSTVKELKERGVRFMTVPETYYTQLSERVGDIAESVNELAKLGILADRDEGGYLLQIFTLPVQDRPTFFYEIIQRHGAEGFGKGNFKALFEAIERDQERRGNL
jgi:4-hydroxyphenylpyruvate dioxygenase